MPPALMLSCVQREAARAATIPQLEAAGLDVRVFLDACDPIGRGGNGPIGLTAVKHARGLGSPVIFCEDDIDLAPDFPAYLSAALKVEAVTYFYLHDRRDRMNLHYGTPLADEIAAGRPMRRRLMRVKRPQLLYGSQCVLVPPGLLPVIERELETFRDAFDGNVQRAITKSGWPVLVALPHPVQHRHDRTARAADSRVKKSLSFGLPRLGGEEVAL